MTDERVPADFRPTNLLEDALARARAGELSPDAFVRVLFMSTLAVPSRSAVDEDGRGLQPLVLDKAGTPMVACFSSLNRAAGVGAAAPYCLAIEGRAFLAGLPPGFGLVLNPGLAAGMDMTPEGIADAVRDLT